MRLNGNGAFYANGTETFYCMCWLHDIVVVDFYGLRWPAARFYRRFTVIERRILTEGWKSSQHAIFEFMSKPVEYKDLNVVVSYNPKYKVCASTFIIACLYYFTYTRR